MAVGMGLMLCAGRCEAQPATRIVQRFFNMHTLRHTSVSAPQGAHAIMPAGHSIGRSQRCDVTCHDMTIVEGEDARV